jgi:hypothetical protein
MPVFLYLVAFVFIILGFGEALVAKNDVQIVTFTLCMGFAMLSIGLSGVISAIQRTIPEKARAKQP